MLTRVLLALAAALLLAACSKEKETVYQGYVEGEFVYVASQLPGRLDDAPGARGTRVRPGDRLFTLEHALESQGVDRAEANLRRAGDTLSDLKKGLRPEEIDQILARSSQAQSLLALRRLEYERFGRLLATGAVSRQEFDQARTAYQSAQGAVADVKAQLATGRLGARVDQILAAQEQVLAATADLEQARWYLDQKQPASTVDALVFDLLHYPGEWVAAGSPVVKLLPETNIKARFFVPEAELGRVRVGQKVEVRCDGCPAPFSGVVSFIFPQAEYTPPVIYSQEFRSKLVFMAEVRFDPAVARLLKPGQPVDVRPGAGS